MRKIISLFLIMSVAFTLFVGIAPSVQASEPEDKEILFNDIPWGSTYKDTTSALKDKYNVDFAGSEELTCDDYLINDLGLIYLKLMYNYTNERVGFCVISTSPVQIAEEEAYIFLKFVFPNNGSDVLYDDYENAVFVAGTYLFSIEPHEKSYVPIVETFMEKYSIKKTDLSYFEKSKLYDKMNTLIEHKYPDRYEQHGRPSVYVYHYHYSDAFNFRLSIDGYYHLCELDAVAITYYTPNTIVKENKAIIHEQIEAARIAYEQKKTDAILATDSSGL